MKTKKVIKKLADVPDRLRKVLYRTLRHNRSVLLRSHFTRTLKRYGRMDARRALKLFGKFLHFQLTIRPRIRLVAVVTLFLILALVGTGRGVDYLHANEQEIKINGQPILVAQKSNNTNTAPAQIESEVISKRSPFEFVRPARGYISQGFRGYHRAIDITDSLGSPIKPLGKGKVEFAGFLPDGRGNVVIIDHGDGLKSLYAHMSKINVGVGNEVTSASTIGLVGLTGHTTGPHVHVEVNDNGIAVDPAKLLP